MRPSSMMRCSCRQFASRSPSAFQPSRIPQPPPQTLPTSCIRPQLLPIRRAIPSAFRRHETTTSGPNPPLESTTTPPESRLDRDQVPAYELTFTCKKCTTRSSHRVSKQGYHHGTVLITCPGCKNRHLISDHLKIFSDKRITIEDLLKEKGQLIKRGSLSAEGDVEFWDDGSTTSRSAHFIPNSNTKSDPEAPEGRLTSGPASSSEGSPESTPEDSQGSGRKDSGKS